MSVVAWIVFGLGAFLCVTNFYLSFLRYPLHRLRGLSKESYRWVSGFPLVGSLFVGLSLLGLHDLSGMIPVAVVLILIDTGGIHWFVGTMIYQFVYGRKHG
jgi:hypothetical protein